MSQKETQISNYKFIETIGEGAFGKVKLATHIPTGEKVAIKILEKSLISGKEELKRIEKEIKYLKKFNHPNIIQIYEVVESKNSFYIVMEYASGGELFNYIVEKEHIKEKEASFFYYQIIQGIIEIHKKHICHRDIKPENLLLTNDKLLKMIDFNLSNEYKDYLSTPCGSPCYAAPEMIKREKYIGIEVDIWASGVILFAMLCGYLPFNDKNYKTLYKDIVKCKIDYPKEDEYIIPNNALDLINKILVVNPQKRITIDKILLHPFIEYGKKQYDNLIAKKKIISENQKQLIIEYMVKELSFNNENDLINKYLEANRHNNYTTTYKLLEKKMIEDRFCYTNIKKCTNIPMFRLSDKQISGENFNKKIQKIIVTDFNNFPSENIKTKTDKPSSTYQNFFHTAAKSKTNYQKISVKKNCLSHRNNNTDEKTNNENNNINNKLESLNKIKNLYDHLLSKKFLIKSIVKKIETSVSQENDKDKTSSTDSRKAAKKSKTNIINNAPLNTDTFQYTNYENKKNNKINKINYNSFKKIKFKYLPSNGIKIDKNQKSYKIINKNINEIANNDSEENLTKKNSMMINLLKKNKKNYLNSPTNYLLSNFSKKKIIYNSKKNNQYMKLPNKLMKLDKIKLKEKMTTKSIKTLSQEEKSKIRNSNKAICSYPTKKKILNKNSLNTALRNMNSKKIYNIANKNKYSLAFNKTNENLDSSENFNFSNNIINTYNTFDINNNINMNFDFINYSKKSKEYNDTLDYVSKKKYNKKISLNKSRIPKKYEFLGFTEFYKKSQRVNVKKKYNFMNLNSLNKNKDVYMSYSEHNTKKKMNDIILNMINQHSNSSIVDNYSICSDYYNFVNSRNQLEGTQNQNNSSKKFASSINNTYSKNNNTNNNQGRNSSRRILKQKIPNFPPSMTSYLTSSKSKQFIRQKLKNLMLPNKRNININITNPNPDNSTIKYSNNNTTTSTESNFLLLSVNMNVNLIFNKIGNYCKKNGLLIKKTGIYNYEIKNKNNDALIVDIIKASPNNILKLFHLKGDESKTKDYISGLFKEIL